ncbi:MAG: EamA/RhaT family transporter, partial [Bradyrhizobium sp.]|nr:EamA/RhaT family transporter [Bradyrhizobium sp.]
AIVLLGEELKAFHLAGYALVIGGVIVASRSPLRPARAGDQRKDGSLRQDAS